MPSRSKPQLTAVDIRIANELVTGHARTVTGAARAVGAIAPGQYAGEHMRKRINAATAEILEAAGVTRPLIARKLRKLMGAKQKKFFAHEGKVVSTRMVDDNEVQARVTVEAAKLHGMYPKESDASGVPGTISIILEQAQQPDGTMQAQRAVIRIGEDPPTGDGQGPADLKVQPQE